MVRNKKGLCTNDTVYKKNKVGLTSEAKNIFTFVRQLQTVFKFYELN